MYTIRVSGVRMAILIAIILLKLKRKFHVLAVFCRPPLCFWTSMQLFRVDLNEVSHVGLARLVLFLRAVERRPHGLALSERFEFIRGAMHEIADMVTDLTSGPHFCIGSHCECVVVWLVVWLDTVMPPRQSKDKQWQYRQNKNSSRGKAIQPGAKEKRALDDNQRK